MNLFENHANPDPRQSFPARSKRDSLKNLLTNMDSNITEVTRIQHTADDINTDQQEPNHKDIKLTGPKLQIPILKKLPLHEIQQIDTGQKETPIEFEKPKATRYIKLASLKGHRTPGHINSLQNKIPRIPLNNSLPASPKQDRLGIVDQLNSEKQSSYRHVPTSSFYKKERTSIIKDIDDDETADEPEHGLDDVLIKFPLLIINPFGRFKYVWDLLMILLLMYFCFILPIRLCFIRVPDWLETNRNTDYDNGWLVADCFLDILVLIDVTLSFFTAYENDAGLIIFKKRKILKRYITRWFCIDLLSAFPINRNIFHLPHINAQDLRYSESNYIAWRLIRLIKLVRMLKLNSSIERLFSLFTFNVDKINIIKFASFITVFMHMSGCIWNMVSELENEPGWQREEGLEDQSVFMRYLSSLYFGLTVLLTIGFGNIHPSTFIERMIANVWMFFGIILYTYIISSLTSSFAKLNESQSVREEKDFFFRAWSKQFRLPYETLDMVLNTIGVKDQSVSTQRIQILNHASKTLADLPKGLYSEIYNTFFHGVIDKILFFRNKPKQFLIRLMPLLKPAIYDQWDYIYKERDPAMEIFFVVKGRVITKCHDRQQKERAQIFVEGSFFGDTDVFLKRNRQVEARAETKCELWKVDKEEFINVLKQFPSIREEVEGLVRIKEAYRKPMLGQATSATLKELDAEGDGFRELEVPAERGIFSAFTAKMMKKIHKGKYRNSNDSQYAYESLDFEPDLPSPVSVSTKNILSEAEWKHFEHSMTQKLVKRRGGVISAQKLDDSAFLEAGSLQQQFKYKNTGVKRRMLKRKENRESLRKNILVNKNNWNSPTDSVENMAKKKLLEDLQQKQIEISELTQLDEMLNGKEELEKYRDNVIEKAEHAESNLEKMFTDAETMLAALEQFEDGLSELMGKRI